MSLLILLLMSVGVQAENYDIIVAGRQVTSDNASDVLNDGTVSFDNDGKILTMNGAMIDMSSNSTYVVSSSITNLQVKLVGSNTVKTSSAWLPVFQLSGGSSASLTFVAEKYGSLTIEGIYDFDNVATGYSITNSFNESETDGWYTEEDNDNHTYVKIGYREFYNLWVNGEKVSSENMTSIKEGTIEAGCITFDGEQTLTLKNVPNIVFDGAYPFIKTSMDLTVKLEGTSEFDCGNDVFITRVDGDNETHTLTFTTDANDPGMLILHTGSTFSGFDLAYQNGLAWKPQGYYNTSDSYIPAGWIAQPSLGLTVAGKVVTAGNATNILNDENQSVSYDEDTKTLTLNEASLDVNGNNAIESGLDVLTVYLIGENYITCHNNDDIAFKGTVDGAKVVFDTDASSIGSMQVQVNDNQMFVDITPEYADVLVYERNGWTYTISEKQYDIVVAGTHVKASNAADVLGDDKVSYDAETNTLTLNGATIGGSGSEVTEVSGISYTGTDDLTISLKGTNTISGTNGCNAISYVGEGETTPKLIFTKGDNNACSLQLNGEEGTSAIAGFSAIQGVWSLGATDNGLAIIAEDAVRYSAENGLEMETLVNYTVNYVTLSSTLIASYYGLSISGVPVYEGNKANITGKEIDGNGTASFNSETNTLTLNNINLNSDYSQNDGDQRISIVTSLAQLNINLIGENQTYAIKTTNENSTLTFKSAEENKATARLSFWYNANPQLVGFGEGKVTYEDGLCLRDDASNTSFPKIVALYVPKVVTEEKERGLYYPDHEFTFSLEEEVEGFDIYYANMLGGDPVKTTNGKFTLGTGRYLLRVYPIYPGMDTEPSRNWQFSSEISAKVIAKPTFTVADGTYNEPKNVKLENIPEQGADAESYPQVWYYLNDVKNDSVRYDATKGIDVTESCKVSVYVLDEDSSRVIKSEPVEAQYVIRQDAGLAFTAEEAEYTIGGENNQELPTLANTNNVAVTYSSSNETVATVDTDGKVTIVGMGETTITAASQQTDELLAGEATYVLKVYKDINYSSITVTLSELTYNGEAQTPTVTVKDGETVLTAAVNYLVIAPEAGNTNAVDATAANAPVVTINANTDAEVNYYVGERQVKFGIAPKALTDEMVTLSKTSFEYSGENQKPTVTVADGELMTTNDYTITNEGGVEVGEYTVKVVAKNNYTGTVEKNFEIVTRTLEIGKDVNFVEGQKWASYYTTTEDLVLPEGLMAYIVTATTANAVSVKAINYVPKNVAVLIEKASTTTTDNTSAEGNLLQGTASATNVSDIAGNAYVLYNNGFTRATSGQIPAHRAYLVLAEPAGARLAIFDEETTGMEAVSRDKVATYENIYDLQGRKISNGQWSMVNGQLKKGLYIVNGKKVVIK